MGLFEQSKLIHPNGIVGDSEMSQSFGEVQQLFSTILDTMDSLVLIFDDNGKVLWMNRACEIISGYTLEEVEGLPFWDIFLLEEEKEPIIYLFFTNKNENHVFYNQNHWVSKYGDRRFLTWSNQRFTSADGKNHYLISTGIDITEQRQAKQELQVAQQELIDTIKQHQGVIFKFKKMGDQFIATLCEGELLNLFDLSSEKMVGHSLDAFLPPHIAKRTELHFEMAWQGHSPVYFELQLAKHALLLCLRPIKRDGKVIEVIGSAIDITERRNIELAFRESEARYRLIAENTTDMISVTDSQGRMLYSSPSYKTVLGYDCSEMEGTLRLDLYHPDDVQQAEQALKDIVQTKKPLETIYRFRHQKGHWLYLESRGVPVLDEEGNVQSIVNVSRDITNRKQKEIELEETKEQIKNIFDSLDEVFFSYDMENHRMLQLSSSCEAMFGQSHAKIMEDPSLLLSSVHPDDKFQLDGTVQELLKGKVTVFEHRIQHPIEGVKWLKGRAIPVMKEGQMIRLDGILTDITEQRNTEELLRKWERVSAIGEMAAGIAHEIRNPLTTLKGFLQLLQKESDNPMYFDLMRSELDRIELVTNEFLMLAKPQAIQHKQIDLAKVLEGIVTLFNTQAILRNILIVLEASSNAYHVVGDPNHLKQVFINILKNALESMTNGGTIRVKLAKLGDKQVTVAIKDEGSGIPKELIPKLGEPFYTLKEKGTGLGLMISSKIIKEHRGNIQISSKVGKGTTVLITFPLYQGEES